MNAAIQNFKKYLMNISVINEETFNQSSDFLEVRRVNKGEYFVKEGSLCHHVAYINQGLFRIYYLKNGNEVNTCFCFEQSIMSSFESFVNRTPARESIQAREDATIVTLAHEGLIKLYDTSPEWLRLGRLLTEKECLRLSNRASSLSFETAMEKYQNLLKHQPEIVQRVAIQDIASYLGVSRETLSRIRAKV